MFSYYGSKSKIVHLYPRPKFDLIIEPFAGSARYALEYFERDVILIDKDPNIITIWKYLQLASTQDILGLPEIKTGDNLKDFPLSDAERLFLAFVCSHGTSSPQHQVGKFNSVERDLRRIADSLFKIRHWRLIHGTKECLDNIEATWFIDPPYFNGGHKYRFNNKHLDFVELAAWSQIRRGQVIVCENDSADWLPFYPLKKMTGAYQTTYETWWTNEPEPVQQGLF